MSFWSWWRDIFTSPAAPPPVPVPPPPTKVQHFVVGVHAFTDSSMMDDSRLARALVVWDGVAPGFDLCDDFGRFWLPPLPQQGFNITVSKPGYVEAWQGVELLKDMDLNFVLSPIPNVVLPPDPPPPPGPASQRRIGLVRANRHCLVDDGVAV